MGSGLRKTCGVCTRNSIGVLGEVPDGLAQERAERRVIGVEHDDDLARGVLQAVVHVAGLGVLVLRARLVACAHRLAERGQGSTPLEGGGSLDRILVVDLLLGATVVEQPHRQLARRVIHRLRGGDGRREDVFVLVVGRDEDVDRGQMLVVFPLQRFAIQWVGVDDQADDEDQHAVELGQHEHHAEREVDGAGRSAAACRWRARRCSALPRCCRARGSPSAPAARGRSAIARS